MVTQLGGGGAQLPIQAVWLPGPEQSAPPLHLLQLPCTPEWEAFENGTNT